MRWRPLTWLLLSVMFFVAAAFFWRLGDEWAAKKAQSKPVKPSSTNEVRPSTPAPRPSALHSTLDTRHSTLGALPPQHGNLNSPPPVASATNRASKAESPLAHRLSN